MEIARRIRGGCLGSSLGVPIISIDHLALSYVQSFSPLAMNDISPISPQINMLRPALHPDPFWTRKRSDRSTWPMLWHGSLRPSSLFTFSCAFVQKEMPAFPLSICFPSSDVSSICLSNIRQAHRASSVYLIARFSRMLTVHPTYNHQRL
jgi:hypothetical protein